MSAAVSPVPPPAARRPTVAPPRGAYVRERREAQAAPLPQEMAREANSLGHAPLLKSAVELYRDIWPPVKDPALAPQKEFSNLPTAAEFFAPGELNPCCNPLCPILGGLTNWKACCGDVSRIVSSPRGPCFPCQNGALWCCYNFCAGAASGLFIWPTWCPCGFATCCCYGPGLWTRPWDFCCCCCKGPSDRCDSLLFISQRFTIAGSDEYRELWPTPPGLGIGQVGAPMPSLVFVLWLVLTCACAP